MTAGAHEVNFDGIVGPTHNYAGLSFGNVASMANRAAVSSPKRAALQGLAKMKFVASLGARQAVLPPHERPHLPTLRRLGYAGSDGDVLDLARRTDAALLAAVSSSSAMWTANAATVSASGDTRDGRVHFTPANLLSNLHRSLEAPATARVLRAIFSDERRFAHHDPLPAATTFSDEGAANHTRLVDARGGSGAELFTYGSSGDDASPRPAKYPARQTARASRTIAFMHRVQRAVFVQQSPAAIDAGAFHNDVVAVGHRDLLLYHEKAWVGAGECVEALRQHVPGLRALEAKERDVPLADAIASYLFNSQLVTVAGGTTAMIAPMESHDNARTHAFIQKLLADGVISHAHFVDLRESMRNGGGPACLRLRVVLTEEELAATQPGVLFDDALHERLVAWVERHYRDALAAADLADPKLLEEGRAALDELTGILSLGWIYEFQK